jgi:hypothetical protein
LEEPLRFPFLKNGNHLIIEKTEKNSFLTFKISGLAAKNLENYYAVEAVNERVTGEGANEVKGFSVTP